MTITRKTLLLGAAVAATGALWMAPAASASAAEGVSSAARPAADQASCGWYMINGQWIYYCPTPVWHG
jgi:hypothetical protein